MAPADRTRLGLGVLLSAGHPLDSILGMTFGQIEECIISMEMVRVRRIDELARPILGALGARTGVRVEGQGQRRVGKRAPMRKNADGGTDVTPYALDGEKGEEMLRSGFGLLGISVQQR